jgi:hypothetical protein
MGRAQELARIVSSRSLKTFEPGNFTNWPLECLFALYAKMAFDQGLSGVSWDNPQEDFHGAEV